MNLAQVLIFLADPKRMTDFLNQLDQNLNAQELAEKAKQAGLKLLHEEDHE